MNYRNCVRLHMCDLAGFWFGCLNVCPFNINGMHALFFYFCACYNLTFFFHIPSSWVKVRLHAKFQFPGLTGSATGGGWVRTHNVVEPTFSRLRLGLSWVLTIKITHMLRRWDDLGHCHCHLRVCSDNQSDIIWRCVFHLKIKKRVHFSIPIL